MNNKIQKVRIPVELRRLKESYKDHGISCTSADDCSHIEALIPGPPNSPYAEQTFHLNITIGDQYPFRPPTFKFQTPIFHPNIDSSGNICLDLLRMPPNGTYNPALTLESILLSIRLLLSTPNAEDPLQCDAAEMYQNNRELFEKIARSHTGKGPSFHGDEGAIQNKCEEIPGSSGENVLDSKTKTTTVAVDLAESIVETNNNTAVHKELRKLSKDNAPQSTTQSSDEQIFNIGTKRTRRSKVVSYKI